MFRSLTLVIFAAICASAQATTSKSLFDDQMVKNAQAANEQISNLKLDDYTRLRGVFYMRDSSSFIYYYLTNFPKEHPRFKLNSIEAKNLSDSLIEKTCNGPFKEYIAAPYHINVSHIYNDRQTNNQYHKTTVNNKDCELLNSAQHRTTNDTQDFSLILANRPVPEKIKYQQEPWGKCASELIENHPSPKCYIDLNKTAATQPTKCEHIPANIEELGQQQTKRSKNYELLFIRGKFRKIYKCEISPKGNVIRIE